MANLGKRILSIVQRLSKVEMYGHYIGRGASSVSIAGRLSTLQSVHYQRFHCNGHVGYHCSEVPPCLEIEMYG